MRFLLTLAVSAGCTTDGALPHEFRCTAIVTCDGEPLQAPRYSTCAQDKEEALSDYKKVLLEWYGTGVCPGETKFRAECAADETDICTPPTEDGTQDS